MRKQALILASIFFLVAFLATNASALSCEITVSEPQPESYHGSDVQISWLSSNCSDTFDIDYKENSCLGEEGWKRVQSEVVGNEFLWESGRDSGELCIRVIEDNNFQNQGVMKGTFFIDGIAPEADAGGPYQCDEGTSVRLNANASRDNIGPLEYWWELDGDNDFDDAFGVSPLYGCENGDDNVDIAVKVIDRAGNSDIAESSVEISNVAPICEAIIAPSRGVVDSLIKFSANATDVEADLPLSYSWNFGDGGTSDVNPTNHTYTKGDSYNVTVEVKDDGNEFIKCPVHTIVIVEPIELESQEVAAYYNLNASFPSRPGEAPNSFDTGLEGEVSCTKETGPEGMKVYASGSDCVVKWGDPDARPTNDERGTQQVVIKARSGENELPFVFDITVYSWIIPLHEGWNLISIPLVPDNNSINNVIIDQIFDQLPVYPEYVIFSYQYNADTGKSEWLKSRRTVSGRTLHTVDPGYAYFVKVAEDTEIKGFGTHVSPGGHGVPPGFPPEVILPTNRWSLIGRFGIINQMEPRKAGPLHKDVALQSILRLPERIIGHVYKTDSEGKIYSVEDMENNMGYWFYTQNNRGILEEVTYTPIDKFYEKN